MQSVCDFMESPLALWARSVLFATSTGGSQIDYELFPNGEYFHAMLKRIDFRLESLNLPNDGDPMNTTRSRLLNLDYIMRSIRSFYHEMLNTILLVKMPNIYQIAKYPQSGNSRLNFIHSFTR